VYICNTYTKRIIMFPLNVYIILNLLVFSIHYSRQTFIINRLQLSQCIAASDDLWTY